MSDGLHKLDLTLNPGDSSERTYRIYPIQTVDIRSQKDAFSIAPPGLGSRDNILMGVSGMQADITINCHVWDDGEDRSQDTHSSGVESVQEQIRYLEDDIHAPDFNATWELDHVNGSAFNDDSVFVESIEPTVFDEQSPKWKECSINLRRGGSV